MQTKILATAITQDTTNVASVAVSGFEKPQSEGLRTLCEEFQGLSKISQLALGLAFPRGSVDQ